MKSTTRRLLLAASSAILVADLALVATFSGTLPAAGRLGAGAGSGTGAGQALGLTPVPGGASKSSKGHAARGSGTRPGSAPPGSAQRGGASVGAGPGTPAGIGGGQAIRRYTAMEMAHLTGGQAQAVQIAQTNDVVSATAGQIDQYIPAMRAANPHLVILLYINGTMSLPSEQPSIPAGDYLTSNGQRCYHGSNASMDPLNADWRANRINRARQAGAYDGVFLDVMGPAPASPGYLTCLPANPRTGAPYQRDTFVRDTSSLAQAIAAAIPDKMVVSNGLDSGPSFFGIPTTPLEQVASGAVGEGWMRNSGAPMSWFPSASQWLEDVHMLQAAGNRQMYVIVKTWVGGDPTQWHEFALATYLMGSGPGTAFEFSPANTTQGVDGDSPLDHINLGVPVGSMQQSGNGYERAFSGGLVLVNPTAAPVSFSLPAGASYSDAAGNHDTSTVTLAPDSGSLLSRLP